MKTFNKMSSMKKNKFTVNCMITPKLPRNLMNP